MTPSDLSLTELLDQPPQKLLLNRLDIIVYTLYNTTFFTGSPFGELPYIMTQVISHVMNPDVKYLLS